VREEGAPGRQQQHQPELPRNLAEASRGGEGERQSKLEGDVVQGELADGPAEEAARHGRERRRSEGAVDVQGQHCTQQTKRQEGLASHHSLRFDPATRYQE